MTEGMGALLRVFDENALRLEKAETRVEALYEREARLLALLRECQSALTGPSDLRQRIEDEVGCRA